MFNAKVVKAQLVLTGHSMKELEGVSGLSKTSLWRRMTGKSEFRISELQAICDFLGIKQEDCFAPGSCTKKKL